jgi:uncharacterized protein YeaO (DUF488 family)
VRGRNAGGFRPDELRAGFDRDPGRFGECRARDPEELAGKADGLDSLHKRAAEKIVRILRSARDRKAQQRRVLAEFVSDR